MLQIYFENRLSEHGFIKKSISVKFALEFCITWA